MLLNVIERESERESGETSRRPPVVFLHGLFGRARNMGFVQRIASRTHRTLALDLRNHGSSPHGPMNYLSMVDDVIETLRARNALPAILVGHSMGGKVAMGMALRNPELVSGVLVGDMAPTRTGHGQAPLAEAMLHMHFPETLDRAAADRFLAKEIPDRSVRDLMLQNLTLGDQPGWQIGLKEIVDGMPNIENWPYVPEGYAYTGPTLFLRGEHSPYINDTHEPTMQRLFPAYRLETIPDAGHWLHVDNPQKFSDRMIAFIDSIQP